MMKVIALSALAAVAAAAPARETVDVTVPDNENRTGHLWFRYENKPASNPDCDQSREPSCSCGDVDVAAVTPIHGDPTPVSRVPAVLFEPWNANKLKAYADLTVQLYNYGGAKLELGRCPDIGYPIRNGNTPGPWAPTPMMTEICEKQCDCAYPNCPDAKDEPLKGKWCSLCGPKYNAVNFYVALWRKCYGPSCKN